MGTNDTDPDHGYHNSRGTPEESLLAAIVRQAVADLDDPDETIRYEATEFFLQQRGGWANMRRLYFGALGLDEGQVLKALAPKLTPMERPIKREGPDLIVPLLPEGTFTPKVIQNMTGRDYVQIRGWLEHLTKRGVVVRTGRGEFTRTDCIVKAAPRPRAALKRPDEIKAIVYRLLAEPHTFKDLIIATQGDVSESGIRNVLNAGRAAFELSRDDEGRYLVRAA